MTEVFLPDSISYMWDIIDKYPDALIYAGGTDLLVKLRRASQPPATLICLERIKELQGVSETTSSVYIGSCSTITSLLENTIIRSNFRVLVKSLITFGSPPVRNMGTIGGNIVTASPAGNTLPPLYILDAVVQIRSREAHYDMPVNKFITGPGKTLLRRGEIVSGILLRKCSEFNLHHFEKVGQRNAMAIAAVSLAAVLRINGSGVIEKARLAWGAVGPTVLTSAEIDDTFTGRLFTGSLFKELAPLIDGLISPISDVRAGSDYRRRVSANLVKRLVTTRVNLES